MAFKMKGHTLPGIKQREVKDTEYGKLSAGKRSPGKWVQAVAALAPLVMDMMKKNKDKE
jgi:hypothetical protein